MIINDKKKEISKNNKLNKVTIHGILCATSTVNNLILTYTDLLGNPLYWYSCGRIPNIQKGSRSNYFIILETIEKFSLYLESKNIKNIHIKVKGFGLIRKTLLKALKKTNLQVFNFYNVTLLPHNGCRPKKYRRI
jgi:small subunit ribosomal protein S11